MEEQDEHGAPSNPLRARMRDTLAGVRRSAAEAADRLKNTAAVERLGATVDSWRVVKRASSAQQRGNHAMAYRLLEPEARENPDDERLISAYWSAALACERVDDAVPALQRIIRKLASSGRTERAAELWLELHGAAPAARVDPGALVRLMPALMERAEPEQVVEALREAVHPDNIGLSPGLAVRVAELALERDPRTALCAAHRALASADLDEAKRANLEGLVAELERSEAEAAVAPAAPPPVAAHVEVSAATTEAAVTQAAVDAALSEPAPVARFVGIKLTEAMPTRLREEGLGLQLFGGRKVRVAHSEIAAVAVAKVAGLGLQPVVVIDLLLNWEEPEATTLRVVRLRNDGFDPRMVMETSGEEAKALREFLTELIVRSDAVPLPDPDGVLGANTRSFADLATYEREILLVKS